MIERLQRCAMALLAIILVGLVTGCDIAIKSPTDLIKRPQVPDQQREARVVIDANLPSGGRLIRPLESKSLGSVGILDWNGDGKGDYYAFYRTGESHEVGMLVLTQREGKWHVEASLKEVGSDIAFAEFVDFNADGYLDLVLGSTAKDDIFKGITVFEYKKGKNYIPIYKDVYTELRIEDLNIDGLLDLVLFKLDRNKFASAQMLEYREGAMLPTADVAMDAYISGYYAIQYGKVSAERYGFTLDFTIGSKSASNILYYDKGRLKLAFDAFDNDSPYALTVKDDQVTARDVDGDGVLELGNRLLPGNYYDWSDDPPYLNMWYQWDGKDELDLITMNYLDEREGYRLDFPEQWTDAVLSGQLTLIKSRRFLERNFLDIYLRPEEAVLYKLLSIEVISKQGDELQPSYDSSQWKLAETERKVYLASVLDLAAVSQRHRSQCEALYLDAATLQRYFFVQ